MKKSIKLYISIVVYFFCSAAFGQNFLSKKIPIGIDSFTVFRESALIAADKVLNIVAVHGGHYDMDYYYITDTLLNTLKINIRNDFLLDRNNCIYSHGDKIIFPAVRKDAGGGPIRDSTVIVFFDKNDLSFSFKMTQTIPSYTDVVISPELRVLGDEILSYENRQMTNLVFRHDSIWKMFVHDTLGNFKREIILDLDKSLSEVTIEKINNNYYLLGRYTNYWYNGDFGLGSYLAMFKLDLQGNILLKKLIPFHMEDFYPNRVEKLRDGNFLLYTGLSPDSIIRNDATCKRTFMKLDTNFNLIWENFVPENILPFYIDFKEAQDGSIYLCGVGNGGVLSKLSPDGQLLWKRSYLDKLEIGNILYGCYFDNLVILPSGNIILNGRIREESIETGKWSEFFWQVKVDKNGCVNGDCDDVIYLSTKSKIPINSGFQIQLIPNPGADHVELIADAHLPEYSRVSVELLNAAGAVVLRNVFGRGEPMILRTKDLSPGNYAVRYIMDEKYAGSLMWTKINE